MAESRVTVISPTFWPEPVGTPHYVADLVRAWNEQGFSPQVVCQQPYYPGFRRFPGFDAASRRQRFANSVVIRLPTLVPRGGKPIFRAASELNFLAQALFARVTCRVKSSERVLAVSPGVPLAALAGRFMCRRGGRVVVLVHDIAFGLATATSSMGHRLVWLLRAVEVWALNRADAVVVLSSAMEEELRLAGVRTAVEVVPLWPTLLLSRVIAPPSGHSVVMYSGNLGRKQGVDRLLELAEGLRERHPTAIVRIQGDGSERARIERLATERGLDNVEFRDFVSVEDLAESLAAAHVHVIPQLPEGARFAVPSKIVNIMAVGRPVVATGTVGSPLHDLAQRAPGLRVVDPADVGAFVDEVASLLANPDVMAELGRAAHANMATIGSRRALTARLAQLVCG